MSIADLADARRRQLEAAVKTAVMNLFAETGANYLYLPLGDGLQLAAGPFDKLKDDYRLLLLTKFLKQVKNTVVGKAMPRWDNSPQTTATRGFIADLCDITDQELRK